MRNAVTGIVFYGWLLMAVSTYAQGENLDWQRVPATITPVNQAVVAGLPQPGLVQPAITWKPVAQPYPAAANWVSQAPAAYAGYTAPAMTGWQPVMPVGATAMPAMGTWQMIPTGAIPMMAAPMTQWRPVTQPTGLQPAVYWQAGSAANQVPRLGGQSPAMPAPGVRLIPCGGSTIPSVDPYARSTPMGQGSQSRYRPIVSLGSVPENYQMGQGMLGQPKVYVPGQPLRNFVRYLTP